MLVGDNLPELGTDLVTALATLDGDDLTHGYLLEVTASENNQRLVSGMREWGVRRRGAVWGVRACAHSTRRAADPARRAAGRLR